MPAPEADSSDNPTPKVDALEPDYGMREKINSWNWSRCAACGVLFRGAGDCNCGKSEKLIN